MSLNTSIDQVKDRLRMESNFRNQLEQQLIGLILDYGAYSRLCHILSDKNFNNPKHRVIYDCCKNLFLKKEINTVTVYLQLQKSEQEAISFDEIINFGKTVTAQSEVELALLLLQIDLTQKFEALMSRKLKDAANDFEFQKEGVLKEMYQVLKSPDGDIFELIAKCSTYFTKHHPDDLDFRDFEDALQKKILNIKKLHQVNLLLAQLYSLSSTQEAEIKNACHVFADAISFMISCKKIKPNIQTALTALYL